MTEENEMILDKLTIERVRWGDDEGQYKGKITYSGGKGEITMNVSPEITHDLLRFCGGAIKRFSETAAAELQVAIEESIEEANKNTTLNET